MKFFQRNSNHSNNFSIKVLVIANIYSEIEASDLRVNNLIVLLLRALRHLTLVVDWRLKNNLAVGISFSLTLVDLVLNDIKGMLICSCLFLGLGVLLKQFIVLSELILYCLLSESLLFFLVFDLLGSSSSLNACFKHISTVTFRSCRIIYKVWAVCIITWWYEITYY